MAAAGARTKRRTKKAPRGLSVRAYAAHRKQRGLAGGTNWAVTKALRDGRIKRNREGRIDPKQADAAWAANSDPARVPGGNGASSATGSLLAQKIAKEELEVQLRRIKIERESGRAVPLDELRPRLFEIVRELRDALLDIGTRIAPDVLSLEDLRAVADLIEGEIRTEINGTVERLREAVGKGDG